MMRGTEEREGTPRPSSPHADEGGGPGERSGEKKILVVEDQPEVAEVAREVLETLGYRVPAILGDADDACAVAARERVDLVLLDIRLPGDVDGIEAGDRIREELGIPVVYATAAADRRTVRRAGASRPYGYIVKPYLPADLKIAIELALERRRAERLIEARESRFRRLIENAYDLTTVLDRDGTIRYQSPSVRRITGYEPEELVQRCVFDFIHPEDVAEVEKSLRRLARAPDTPLTARIRFRHRDGSWRTLETTGAAFREGGSSVQVVANSRDVTERVELAEELERMAYRDPLTGLANRRDLEQRGRTILALAARRGERSAMVYIDLARFKAVNDTLGHAAGDEYLVQVARRFEDVARESDIVARIGGDEFAALLSDVTDREGALTAARRLLEALSEPVRVADRAVHAEAHFGVALFPDHGGTVGELLSAADRAMYESKTGGVEGPAFYRPSRQRRLDALQLEGDLRRALAGDELRLYFQSILRAGDGSVEGAEMLLRWEHPELGHLRASDFLPAVQGRRLLRHLDEWVVGSVLEGLERGDGDAPRWAAVNLSAPSIASPRLVRRIASSLEARRISPDRLVIEVTGRGRVPNRATAMANCRKLRELGVGIALDDFGTSSAGFDLLGRSSADYLKLDRALLADIDRNPETAGLARAVVELGHSLGMRIVAKGIERRSQDEWARESGCDLLQGFLYHAPAPGGKGAG